jgi:hypothetical protein
LTDWDEIYAHVVSATGWSWDQVDALTIPRYRALARYWERFPPVHLLLRALVGYQPRQSTGRVAGAAAFASAPAPFDEIAALAPGGSLSIAALAKQ